MVIGGSDGGGLMMDRDARVYASGGGCGGDEKRGRCVYSGGGDRGGDVDGGSGSSDARGKMYNVYKWKDKT